LYPLVPLEVDAGLRRCGWFIGAPALLYAKTSDLVLAYEAGPSGYVLHRRAHLTSRSHINDRAEPRTTACPFTMMRVGRPAPVPSLTAIERSSRRRRKALRVLQITR